MRLADFEAMVRRMTAEVPAEYLDGVAEIRVDQTTVPHPSRAEIYTLGECIPVPAADGDPDTIQSRIVLYHGSFRALAGLDPAFDWRDEAWETLTHELRHHLEWRARAPDLEAFDAAAEANYARHDGEPFDALFYLDGESVAPDVYQVDHDFFLDRLVRTLPPVVEFSWHGQSYRAEVPDGITAPVYLLVIGVDEPPPGELIVVLRRKARLRDLFRRPEATVREVTAMRAPAEETG